MYIHSYNIGFIDIPNLTTLNIYTVGCPHHCKGCQAPDLQNIQHIQRKELNVDDIIFQIKNSYGFIKGICWLGGDPLYQFDDFIKINKELKEKTNVYITCYTGYTLNDFSEQQKQQLLSVTDILIDGKWQGIPITDPKSNQKIFINKNNTFKNITFNELKQYF